MPPTTPELRRLAVSFYQGSDLSYPDRTAWIAAAVKIANFNQAQRSKLYAYLGDLLANSTDTDLENVWRSADANYGFTGPGAMRKFLTQVRELLGHPQERLRGSPARQS
jgi:hypothetical protein